MLGRPTDPVLTLQRQIGNGRRRVGEGRGLLRGRESEEERRAAQAGWQLGATAKGSPIGGTSVMFTLTIVF